MSKKYFIQNVIIIVLAITIVFLSVGYSVISTNISFNMPSVFKKYKWNVSFNNISLLNDTNITMDKVSGPTLASNDTSLSFKVDFNPTDIYEFSFDVSNNGDYEALLEEIKISATKDGSPLKISSIYEDSDISFVLVNEQDEKIDTLTTLKPNETKKVKVMMKSLASKATHQYEIKIEFKYVKKEK